MIKCNFGMVKLEGNVPLLLTEYELLTKSMFTALSKKVDEEEAKEILKKAFDDGCEAKEENTSETEELFKRLGETLGESIVKILEEIAEGGKK